MHRIRRRPPQRRIYKSIEHVSMLDEPSDKSRPLGPRSRGRVLPEIGGLVHQSHRAPAIRVELGDAQRGQIQMQSVQNAAADIEGQLEQAS